VEKEGLPVFCDHCQTIGHAQRHCRRLAIKDNRIDKLKKEEKEVKTGWKIQNSVENSWMKETVHERIKSE